ncbi:MAG: RNA polymerase sigma factor [candidate division Zixibacteria bacterium]|nr:RNA polymerase sigma factor [candidate division Zixibacteria bacterium]MDH3937584.1 RNA polymerase sigma factor [candidate division Zixibacteria bacterium]MDH4035551.1 RNA polymerase sigma factor [candidate division Zixibacteria bacterium]
MDRNKVLFWKLVEPEHLKARAYCRKLMRNREDGDDLYQDSLVSALTKFGSLKETKAFKPWLYRIITNGYISRVRRPWYHRLLPIDDQIEATVAGENPVPMQAAKRRLEIAFRAVSPADRALITLFEIQGWSVAELTGMTGKTAGNIKVRMSRARSKMRDALTKYFAQADPDRRIGTINSKDKVCVVTKPVKD